MNVCFGSICTGERRGRAGDRVTGPSQLVEIGFLAPRRLVPSTTLLLLCHGLRPEDLTVFPFRRGQGCRILQGHQPEDSLGMPRLQSTRCRARHEYELQFLKRDKKAEKTKSLNVPRKGKSLCLSPGCPQKPTNTRPSRYEPNDRVNSPDISRLQISRNVIKSACTTAATKTGWKRMPAGKHFANCLTRTASCRKSAYSGSH